MATFRNDYSEGAHPQILDALVRTNAEATCGYGRDEYCIRAAQTVRARFACPLADVHFMVGGTATNQALIAAALRPWEAVIAAATGHINVHESGAVETCGHKVLSAAMPDGKLTPDAVRAIAEAHLDGDDGHMVVPRMVYVSDSTELGTIYTKAELTALHETCRALGLYLYLDGARMAQALAAEGNDLAPEELAQLCDAFYIGGTKNGLLFGEALVIVNDALKPHYRNVMKQHGAMLAKGRLLGVQFLAYFENDLWLSMGKHAVEQAQALADGLEKKGFKFYVNSPTNQIFPILTDAQYAAVQERFGCEFTAKVDAEHTVARFVTSWATEPSAVQEALAAL